MLDRECPSCGERVFVFTRACPSCGSVSRRGVGGLLQVGGIAILLAAVVTAITVALGGYQLAAATATGDPADAQIPLGDPGDFSWLATAMSDCDTEAKADAGRLHFLVTPLALVAGDVEAWRAKTISDKGTGVLLRADATLDGLNNKTLRLYPADFAFSILDEAGQQVHRWRSSSGVSKFSADDTNPLASFLVQFRTRHSGPEPEWGGSFNHQNATCYWVNVVITD
jgi:hypothetical protein